MIVMSEIKPEVFNKIQELIKMDKYPSVEAFVELAIANQLTLETSRIDTKTPSLHLPSTITAESYLAKISQNRPRAVSPIHISTARSSEPIFGLINRIAPAKIVLRILSNALIRQDSDWINLSEFNQLVTEEAYRIRLAIEKYEKKYTVTRGESLKMGLPVKDLKSQQRFVDVYVGRLRGGDRVEGILGDLEFVNIKKMDTDSIPSSKIGITEYGLQFAAMESPIIDKLLENQEEISSPFTEEETLFLLQHIRRIKPGEYEFLSFLYRSMKGGATDPKKISLLVTKYMEKTEYTPAMIASLQSGAMARLVEMRLIRIVKDGIYTSYKLQQSRLSEKLFSESGMVHLDI
jgi:hypothetical protein